jgi:hypothetical protein
VLFLATRWWAWILPEHSPGIGQVVSSPADEKRSNEREFAECGGAGQF